MELAPNYMHDLSSSSKCAICLALQLIIAVRNDLNSELKVISTWLKIRGIVGLNKKQTFYILIVVYIYNNVYLSCFLSIGVTGQF